MAAATPSAAIACAGKLVVSRRVAFPGAGSRVKYARARHYLAVSEFVKRVLQAGGVPEEKISVVYDGVPLLEPSARHAVMAPAIGRSAKGRRAGARKPARLAGVELDGSPTIWNATCAEAAIFLYITHSEGLGSGALLAMSAGVPVIASNVGGLPEVDPRTAKTDCWWKTRRRKSPAPSAGCWTTAHWPGGWAPPARQTVIEKFTVDRMVRRTMEVYRQVLS